MIKYRPFLMLIGVALLLAGCGQAATLATSTPGESSSPTEPPTAAANTPATPGAQSGSVVVGTSVGTGPITGPPLRDITPVVPTPGSARPLMTPGADKVVTATSDDNGRSVLLSPGDKLKLTLATGLDWTVSAGDPSVLHPDGPDALVGGVGQFTAQISGKTMLTGVGDPPCRKSTPPCGAPSQVFTLTVKVR